MGEPGVSGGPPLPLVDPPLVSIITVVRNGEKHLEQTITSVLGQSYPNIEYLVLDGGSIDGTLDIIRKYERELDYWATASDGGMYFAMNAGIARARGHLIGIINSDDWYEPSAVATAVHAWLASGREAVVYGLTRYYDQRGLDMILSYDHSRLPSRMINHPSCFVPKAVYGQHGTFDTRFRIAADYDLMLRLFEAGVPFRHVEAIIANFRHGGYSARHVSTPEVLRIRREHGHLGAGRYLFERAVWLGRRVLGRVTA